MKPEDEKITKRTEKLIKYLWEAEDTLIGEDHEDREEIDGSASP